MTVTIIGGLDRMVCRYKEICKEHCCTAKVYTQQKGDMEYSIGCSDLLVLFTGTVSHAMVRLAKRAAERRNIRIALSGCGSSSALRNILRKERYLSGGPANSGLSSSSRS